jgi:hypothetical protein
VSLAPAIDTLICGVQGKPPARNEWCPIPGCVARAQSGHHMWARSYLRGQPYDWVQLPSMAVVCNVMGVCLRHHHDLTGDLGGHKGWIKLEHGDVFVYYESVGQSWQPVGPLSPQPKIIATEGERRRQGDSAERAHLHLKEGETCTTCGYTRPVRREPLPKRKTKSWTVEVPEDSEIGADVLDDWVEQFAALLGFEDSKKGVTRYHVLAVVLAWCMQNKREFIEEITEARMR